MTESVTEIIAKLADIEDTANRIVESAEDEKKELKSKMDLRIQQFDDELKQMIEDRIKVIKEKLDIDEQEEISLLQKDTEKEISNINNLYEKNCVSWANRIFESIIEV